MWMETPEALRDTYRRWNRAGRPAQVRSRWKLSSWVRQLPKHEKYLSGLPQDGLDRGDGIQLVGKIQDEDSAVRAFLLAMIWGYGPVGYGPYRSRRVLDSMDAPARLLEVARIAQREGGLEAFEHIERMRSKQRDYLKYLGPAFGTKYLYFLTAAVDGVETTPVMDAVVWRWFRKNVTDTSIDVLYWDSASYAAFLNHLRFWSTSLVGDGDKPLDLDDVEYLIFAAGVNFENNREWSEEWEREAEPLSISELLDRLRAACAADVELDPRTQNLLDDLEHLLEPKLETLDSESA